MSLPDLATAQFAILCEEKERGRPLVMHDLAFGRLIDEVVVPYESGKSFFIDGAPLDRAKIARLKILVQGPGFQRAFTDVHWGLRRLGNDRSRMIGEQYHTRLEAALRESCIDVTSQVISAFDDKIKPRLRDYLPNRQELIQATLHVFVESMKMLVGTR